MAPDVRGGKVTGVNVHGEPLTLDLSVTWSDGLLPKSERIVVEPKARWERLMSKYRASTTATPTVVIVSDRETGVFALRSNGFGYWADRQCVLTP